MKKILVVAIVTLLAAAVGFAATETQIKVQVPFSFNVGDQEYPAGQYIVEVSSARNSVALRNASGEVLTRALTRPESPNRSGGVGLRFNRYGNQHFLAGIQDNSLNLALSLSNLEKQVADTTDRTVTIQRAD